MYGAEPSESHVHIILLLCTSHIGLHSVMEFIIRQFSDNLGWARIPGLSRLERSRSFMPDHLFYVMFSWRTLCVTSDFSHFVTSFTILSRTCPNVKNKRMFWTYFTLFHIINSKVFRRNENWITGVMFFYIETELPV